LHSTFARNQGKPLLAQTVLKINPEQIDQFIKKLRASFDIDLENSKNQYERLRGRIGKETIVVYATGKVIVPAEPLIQRKLSSILGELNPEEFDIVIGSDEAGKGEWLGPLTVAAVALEKGSIPQLQAQGVMDSKQLSVARIRSLVTPIKVTALATKVVVVSPSRFNRLFSEFRSEGKNLNDLLAWGHKTAIDALLTDYPLGQKVKVVIDEFDRMKTSRELEKLKEFEKLTVIQRPRAEELTPVAAASVLARAAREDWIDRTNQKLRVDLRALSEEEVRSFPNVNEVAKVDYIHSP
jgi:ribonuclease HIII